jgi:hypothetical protein
VWLVADLLPAFRIGIPNLRASPQATDFVIVFGERVGSFRYRDTRPFPAAVRAFGQPTRSRADGNVCDVTWASLGVKVRFFAFGCEIPDQTAVCAITVSKVPWRTSRGLAIGDRASRIRRIYPRARFYKDPVTGPTWVLGTRGPRDELGPDQSLVATVKSGRVKTFQVHKRCD